MGVAEAVGAVGATGAAGAAGGTYGLLTYRADFVTLLTIRVAGYILAHLPTPNSRYAENN